MIYYTDKTFFLFKSVVGMYLVDLNEHFQQNLVWMRDLCSLILRYGIFSVNTLLLTFNFYYERLSRLRNPSLCVIWSDTYFATFINTGNIIEWILSVPIILTIMIAHVCVYLCTGSCNAIGPVHRLKLMFQSHDYDKIM